MIINRKMYTWGLSYNIAYFICRIKSVYKNRNIRSGASQPGPTRGPQQTLQLQEGLKMTQSYLNRAQQALKYAKQLKDQDVS